MSPAPGGRKEKAGGMASLGSRIHARLAGLGMMDDYLLVTAMLPSGMN
jgi:hypothetical protein